MPASKQSLSSVFWAGLSAVICSRIGVIVAILTAIALLTWLPYVGVPNEEREGATSISAWGWNIAADSLDSLAPGFEAEHAEIDIRITRSGANMQSRFLLSLAGGVGAPDICQLQEREAQKFTSTHRLADLTGYARSYAKEFAPAFWASGQHEGHTYAIPWDMGPCAVFYKRWVFERHGIDPTEIETWMDFIEVGQRLVDRSGGKTKMMPLSAGGMPDLFQILMQQAGGGVFDKDGRIIIHNAENRRSLEVLRALLESGITTPLEGPELLASFGGDAVACYPAAVWFRLQIEDYAAGTEGKWGVFRLPAFEPGGLRTSNFGGSMLVVPAQTSHVEKAWRFIEHANCRVEHQVQQYRDFGLFPAYLPALDHPYFDQPEPFFGGQRIHRLFAQDIESLSPLIRTRDWSEAERYLRQTITTWAQERLDSDSYLADAADALSRKLRRPIVTSTSGEPD